MLVQLIKMLDQLIQFSNTDILSCIISYLWILDWVRLSRVSKTVRLALARQAVNHAIWSKLSSHIYVKICIEVTQFYLSSKEMEEHADWFGCEHEHDWLMGDDYPREDYVGVLAIPVQISNDLTVCNDQIESILAKMRFSVSDALRNYCVYLEIKHNEKYRVPKFTVAFHLEHYEIDENRDDWFNFYTYDANKTYAINCLNMLNSIKVCDMPRIWQPTIPVINEDINISSLFE